MRSLSESERDRLFSESPLEEPTIPIYVDPPLEITEGLALSGETVGWVLGRRRIVIHEDAFDASDEELHALVAHEIGHHRGQHVLIGKLGKWLTMVISLSIFVGGIVLSVLHLWLVPVFVMLVLCLAPLSMLSSAWLSQRLEFDADRRAVEILGTTEALVALCPSESVPRPSGIQD